MRVMVNSWGSWSIKRVVVNQEDHSQSIMAQGFNVTFDHNRSTPFRAFIFWKLYIEVSVFVKIIIQFYSFLLEIWENLKDF